ncbi:unnamed protein product [Diatraea saccharalis]|uniref:Attacin C-terminal domain-containing protein n=1 Tax=Diatraea saccharalis TaxID=40085 RepID=A0A9N9R9R2_9NEOP|nr:unnamed protein product [Diatraea saccharalis]
MEARGSLNFNLDKSKNLAMSLSKDPITAGVFVNGYKDGNPNAFPKPTGDSFTSAGASLSIQRPPGGLSLTGTHIPDFGNQVTTSGRANILDANDHKVAVNAFTSRVHPSGPTPNYSIHGGGVNYSFRDQLGASASVSHTPIAKITEHSISGSVNLHKTPTSSLDLNAHTSRMQTPFGNSPWQHGGSITFRKQF